MRQTLSEARAVTDLPAELPHTLDALAQSARITSLSGDIETLALLGTQFEDALITTRNRAALIAGRGGYARLQPQSAGFSVSSARVNLRFSNDAPLRLAHVSASDGPAALIAVDAGGVVQHRVQYADDYDSRVAAGLEPGGDADHVSVQPSHSDNVVALPAIRAARQNWSGLTAQDHVNALLVDKGRPRLSCLPYLSSEQTWKVCPKTITPLLEHLHKARRNFVRMVIADGLLQAQAGVLENMASVDGIILCKSGMCSFALDLTEVATAWIVASPLHWQLELYDEQGCAVAAFTAPPLSCGPDWRAALSSLRRI